MAKITVHPLTKNPTKAWQKLQVKQSISKVTPLDPDTPVQIDKVRFVCISDTHARVERLQDFIPEGDVLLHAGDITNVGLPFEIEKFNEFLGKLPHKHKIVIAGNHDLTFDDDMVKTKRHDLEMRFNIRKEKFEDYLNERGIASVKSLLTNCTYLEDSMAEVYGIRIYGAPWQPEFCDWGFNLPRGQACLDKWNKIPEDVDILITHGPPIGHGDKCFDGSHVGCVELLSTIQQRIFPKYHVFGHVHEGYGVTTDGVTTYINASTCTLQYKPRNPPIIFDIPLPEGVSKTC
ncbi:metallophosphoesterase MPPED2-like [Liolophura sinensis]|uniref:metallophosphoesterase MPPED2-like n=1 Tax=Liolophura sinensis TaxID=3198878 RepID=UPI0031597B2C